VYKQLHTLTHLGPVVIVISFPVVLLVFRSMSAVRIVFFTAVTTLAYLAGESLARVLPRPAIIAWAGMSVVGIVVAIALGVLEQGASVPVSLGRLALMAVALGIPLRAFVVQRWPERGMLKTRRESDT